jgi:hypothetical protein
MQSLNQEEFLLLLSKQLNALFIVAYHHRGKYFMAFAFRPNFKMIFTFGSLLASQVLCFDAKLIIKLSALLQGFDTAVCVPLDALE